MPGRDGGSLTVRRSTALNPVDHQHTPGTAEPRRTQSGHPTCQATKGDDSTAPRVHRQPIQDHRHTNGGASATNPRSPTHKWCTGERQTTTYTSATRASELGQHRQSELLPLTAITGPQPEDVALDGAGDPDRHVDVSNGHRTVADLDVDGVDERGRLAINTTVISSARPISTA